MADIKQEIYNNAKNNSVTNPNNPNQQPIQRRRTKTELSMVKLLETIKSETIQKIDSEHTWEDYESETTRIFKKLEDQMQKARDARARKVRFAFVKGVIATMIVVGTISLGSKVVDRFQLPEGAKTVNSQVVSVINKNTHLTQDYQHYWIESYDISRYIANQEHEAQYLYYAIVNLNDSWELDERDSIIRSVSGYGSVEELLAATGCETLEEYRDKAFALDEDVEIYTVETRALTGARYVVGTSYYSIDRVVQFVNESENPYIALYAVLVQMPDEHREDISAILSATVNCTTEQQLYAQAGCKNFEEFKKVVRALAQTIENQERYAELMNFGTTEEQTATISR